MTEPLALWRPDPARAARSQLATFMRFCAERAPGPPAGRVPGASDDDMADARAAWAAFHDWSVREPAAFWDRLVEWLPLDAEGARTPACTSDVIEEAEWFPGLRLSYTAHLLDGRGAPDDAVAVVECHEGTAPRPITRGALRADVARAARVLAGLGVTAGSRVAAVAAHDAATLTLALAAVGLGATWSSCGPELAPAAVVDRFRQFGPELLVMTAEFVQDGRTRDLRPAGREVAMALPTVRHTLFTRGAPPSEWPHAALSYESRADGADDAPFAWPRLPFSHPLHVLYSSGTTGLPKAIVHGAGGTLLEHLKEHRLHCDLGPGDRLLFQTTCGWMMWHWTISALAAGAAVVTYDGSVGAPGPDALWRVAAASGTTVLGVSPALLQASRDAGVRPSLLGLDRVRAVLSTGAVLREPLFDWVAAELPGRPLQSISGGTDIIGCFVLGNPLLPVWRGESQCVSLAMGVRADESGPDGVGELVCTTPFPSRPLGFLGDDGRHRFHEAYFAQRPGRWTHGDTIQLTPRGSARVLGRSDGVLKVRGIRIGPGEITSVAESIDEVREAMAIEQPAPDELGGSRLVLLVVLRDGVALDRPLVHRIKRTIRDRTSADHVPAAIADVAELPATLNGKRSERAARDAVAGRPVINASALRNPHILDQLRDHPALRLDR